MVLVLLQVVIVHLSFVFYFGVERFCILPQNDMPNCFDFTSPHMIPLIDKRNELFILFLWLCLVLLSVSTLLLVFAELVAVIGAL
jgi:hypothetical protein